LIKINAEASEAFQSIKDTFEDKNFKKEFKRLGIKPKKIEVLDMPQLFERLGIKPKKLEELDVTPEDQLKLAESFNQQLDIVINQNLKDFTPQRRKKLNTQQDALVVLTGILPLIIAAATAGILSLTESYLSFFTNVIDVVPPIFVNLTKNWIEGNYKGLEVKATANYLKAHIHRLALIAELKGDTLKNIEKDVREVIKKSQLLGYTVQNSS